MNRLLSFQLRRQGEYYINVDGQNDELIEPEVINDRVAAVLSNKPGTQVLISADKGVDYGTVVTVMAALKNAGVPTVGLMTKPEEQ